MIDKIEKYINENNLIKENENIVVGFSGGADSVLLLYALSELQKVHKYNIVSVHLNHQIREEDAIRDQKFAKDFSNSLGIKCFIFSVDIKKYATDNKISVEDAGRIVRYQKFREVLNNYFKKGVIAVGHHKNDDAETILLNLIRGSGSNGLSGIKPKNKEIVRPLLNLSKLEIKSYLHENKIPYVEDKTNFENDYIRNKIRNILIPTIEKDFNPNFVDALTRSSKILEEENDFLDKYVLDQLNICDSGFYSMLDIKNFSKYHLAVQRRIILKFYEIFKGNKKDITFNNIETIRELILYNKGEFYLEKYLFYLAYGYLYIVDLNKIPKTKTILIKSEGQYRFSNKVIKVKKVLNEEVKLYKNQVVFPTYLLEEGILLRSRRDGDKIRLKGYSKKLKDIFIDEKVPKHLRDLIPIFIYKNDIIWINGFRRVNKYFLDPKDDFMVMIEVEDLDYVK
ncbi:MAG: tRNA lysidine(34) synthetase TilS [Lagierella massiliensis]|nr:tRNA lysidine(34) synthetase TilS [Lagierella massiliensis]